MLGHVTIGCCHITSHHTRDGLLAEVVVEEGIYLLGSLGCLTIDRSCSDIELHRARTTAGNTDIVNQIPSPTGGNLNLILASIHDKGTDFCLIDSFRSSLECGCIAIDREVNDLVTPLTVIADIDRKFTTICSIVFEGDLAIALFHGKGLTP